MKLASRLIFYFVANLAMLLALDYLIDGFILNAQPTNLLITSTIFTVLNNLIRPIVKRVLTTFVIITFGLFSIIINAGTLLLLDFLSQNITINGLTSLVYSALLISIANITVKLIVG